MENVKGLLNHDNGNTYQTIIELLSNGGGTVNSQMSFDMFEDGLGYHLHTCLLNTKNFGLPQNRERIFIVGFDKFAEFRIPKGFELTTKLIDILEDEVPGKYYLKQKQIDKLVEYNKRQTEKGNGFMAKFHNPNEDMMSALKVGGSRCR